MSKWYWAIPVVVLGLGAQWITFDPPAPQNPSAIVWDSPQTQQLAERACMDCHGGNPNWPWYAKISPISWWIYDHVNEGRSELNFATADVDLHKIREEVTEGEMPLTSYTWMHSEAKLSPAEKEALLQGLARTFGPKDSLLHK